MGISIPSPCLHQGHLILIHLKNNVSGLPPTTGLQELEATLTHRLQEVAPQIRTTGWRKPFCKTYPDGPSLLPAASGPPISQLWGCKHKLPFPKKSSRRPVNEREGGRQLRRAPTAKRFRVWNSRSFGTIPSGRIGEFSALISSADLPWKPRSSK